MSRVLSNDPETGIVELFHYDETTDQVTLETIQRVDSLVEQNKSLHNEYTSLDRFGDMTRVASIPMSVYFSLKKQGIVDDQKALRRWLNDPDNRFFRTRPGVL